MTMADRASAGQRGWPAAVIFDLDGTLVDSLPDLAGAIDQLLEERRLPPLGADEICRLVGHGVENLVARALAARGQPLAGAPLKQATRRFLELYAPRAARASRPYPQVTEVLARLAADGVAMAVSTNKVTPVATAMVAELGLAQWLPLVLGGGFEGLALKPDGAPLRRAAELLGVPPEQCLMVGDSSADVGAARAAGMPVVVVAQGYSVEPVEHLQADVVIAGFAQLPEAMAQLARQRRACSPESD